MLRKLSVIAQTYCFRSSSLKDVRLRSFHCTLLPRILRLDAGNEPEGCTNLERHSRSFSEHHSSFKDKYAFEQKCEETLDSLAEYFDELVESTDHLDKADVNYGDGVLTVQFGEPYGTYVINRQSPNCQIWLSSPTSGPKRYDFINGEWIYTHDRVSLHDLLNKEIPLIVKKTVDFKNCAFGKERGNN